MDGYIPHEYVKIRRPDGKVDKTIRPLPSAIAHYHAIGKFPYKLIVKPVGGVE